MSNLKANDRILKLEPIEGKPALSSGLTPDTRLFTGEQNLYLKMDPETCLWSFQYTNNGLLPQGLTGKFTSFKAGLKHAEGYFLKRNVRITQVKD